MLIMMVLVGNKPGDLVMELKLETREARDELWRRWEGKVPNEASELVPGLFELIDEREDEIQRLRRERDFLVGAFLDERASEGSL